MKSLKAFPTVLALTSALGLGSSCACAETINEDFSALNDATVRLLQRGDAAGFARAVAPSIEDWRTATSTNRASEGNDPLGQPTFQKSLERVRRGVEASAQGLLGRANELKVDFSKVRLKVTALPPKQRGGRHDPDLQLENEYLPWIRELEIILTAEPVAEAKDFERLSGEYKLAFADLIKFPGGWRCSAGVQWTAFPAAVADEKTQRELSILRRAAANEGIKQTDDPALGELGDVLIRFIQTRDMKTYEEALLSENREELLGAGREIVAQMEGYGVDLGDAQMQAKEIAIKSLIARAEPGTMEGLEGNQVKVVITAKSSRKSRTGASLTGEYALNIEEAVRHGGRWLVSRNIQWAEFPAEVLDEKAVANLKLENYVAEHGTLPPETIAPDIEFVRFDNQQKLRLADLRGKIVILDFWAVGCGPCQEPLRKMQLYREQYPEWKDRVVVVPISIDDTLKQARNHLERRHWTNTFNVWAGPGGWQSASAKAFRVSAIPMCYVINTNGIIVEANYPPLIDAPMIVNGLIQ